MDPLAGGRMLRSPVRKVKPLPAPVSRSIIVLVKPPTRSVQLLAWITYVRPAR